MRQSNKDAGSVVSERIAFLEGQACRVSLMGREEPVVGVYVTTVPLGREYFFVFEVDGKERLWKTSAVDEIEVIAGDPEPKT